VAVWWRYSAPGSAGAAVCRHPAACGLPAACAASSSGPDALACAGKRRYDNKQSGFGGQTKPVFHKKVRSHTVAAARCIGCRDRGGGRAGQGRLAELFFTLGGAHGAARRLLRVGRASLSLRLGPRAGVRADKHAAAVPWLVGRWLATRRRLTRVAAPLCFDPQAKTTKKITLRLTCTACKTVRLKPIKRAKHFEICDKKPKGKGLY